MLFGFGLDMPKPGPILSDQCRMLANLFMFGGVGRHSRPGCAAERAKEEEEYRGEVGGVG